MAPIHSHSARRPAEWLQGPGRPRGTGPPLPSHPCRTLGHPRQAGQFPVTLGKAVPAHRPLALVSPGVAQPLQGLSLGSLALCPQWLLLLPGGPHLGCNLVCVSPAGTQGAAPTGAQGVHPGQAGRRHREMCQRKRGQSQLCRLADAETAKGRPLPRASRPHNPCPSAAAGCTSPEAACPTAPTVGRCWRRLRPPLSAQIRLKSTALSCPPELAASLGTGNWAGAGSSTETQGP